MRPWITVAAALYPRAWREEFGQEFDALLDDVRPGWRVFANVLGGAITMQMTNGTNLLKIMAATAVLGAIVAGGLSFRVLPRYESTAVISVTPQPDPVRPLPPQVLQERTAERVAAMEAVILSNTELSIIIQDPRLNIYRDEVKRMPLEDVIEEMRRNIRIQALPSREGDLSPIMFIISFSYPDQVKAQATVRSLAAKFSDLNLSENQVRGNLYRGFWGDISARYHTPAAPPPPAGDVVNVLETASQPKTSPGPNRVVYLAWGLGIGLLLGPLTAFAIRWPRAARQLAACAAVGFVLAAAVSFLIPNRYTSTAVMMITPPTITENPLAPPPPATPAAEFLRQMKPGILSAQNLSKIVDHLDLYHAERAAKPMDQVVRNMLTNDLRIAPLDGSSSVIHISFSYSDRYKALQTVEMLMESFDDQYLAREKSNASQSEFLNQVYQRKAGENIETLDVPSLPISPTKPNRLVIAFLGLGLGLLLGAITLYFHGPRDGILQPASPAVPLESGKTPTSENSVTNFQDLFFGSASS